MEMFPPADRIPATRNPRIDPQPGDELRIDGLPRRVVRVDDGIVWCQSGNRRHQMLLTRWQKWCEAYGDGAAMAASQT
jgi:hypothetical protein